MNTQSHYEPCEECGAALDAQQRYCVNCAARRPFGGANPSSRYFAAMSKRARRPARPPAKAAPTSRAAAVGFFALLPIAVALGVVVGHNNSGGNDQALLEALRHQNAAVAATSAGTAATASTTKRAKAGHQKANKSTMGGGRVVAKTEHGVIHQVTGYKPTKKTTEEDTKLVEGNVKQTGQNYIKAQTSLPDVVVVGGNPDSAPALPTAGNQP